MPDLAPQDSDPTKSDRTKHLIEQAFWNLLNQRPLGKITVKDISKVCGINRNTFYYHFKNIPDLIESVVKSNVDDILTKYPLQVDTIEDCFIAAISFARENETAINHIYHSTNRAIFERHLWHICDYIVSAYLSTAHAKAPFIDNPTEHEAIKNFLKYECFGFVIDWLNHGMPEIDRNSMSALTSLFKSNGLNQL